MGDEQSGTYFDIGDKKAREKTSQALREGQKKIRQSLHSKSKTASNGVVVSHANRGQAGFIPSEGCFGYSAQVPESHPISSQENVMLQTQINPHRAQNPSFVTVRAPQDAPGTAVPQISRSPSPELQNSFSHVAMKVEDEVRYFNQVYQDRLLLSLLQRYQRERGPRAGAP